MEINRTLKNKIPNYIIGFSQFDNYDVEFSKIWKVINFKIDTNDWKLSLSELLNHIKNNNFNKEIDIIKPTVFVEGLTDKNYLDKALLYYYPEYIEKIDIKTQSSAGSSWVANQLISWSHSMFKDLNGNYIKAIGVFDNDESGIEAKKQLDLKVLSENQKSTFKTLVLKPNYNQSVLAFYQKGCKIDIEIESLFSVNILKNAENAGFLENRKTIFKEVPKDWNQLEVNAKDYLISLGLSDEIVYLKKVKKINKECFLKLIGSNDDLKTEFFNFKKLLEDIFEQLNINTI
ncbi:hypothetical protein ACTS93_14030 [Empedobacter falsenii]